MLMQMYCYSFFMTTSECTRVYMKYWKVKDVKTIEHRDRHLSDSDLCDKELGDTFR